MVSGISQFIRQNTAQMIVSVIYALLSSKQAHQYGGLILLSVILMSFAALRRLRFVVLILARADMAGSQRYVVGMELMLPELSLLIQDIHAT